MINISHLAIDST